MNVALNNLPTLQKLEQLPLDMDNLKAMLHSSHFDQEVRILHYNDISKYSLQDFLENPFWIILLSIESPGAPPIGHFIALFKGGSGIEHFDSYGLTIDQEISITHERGLLTKFLQPIISQVFQGRATLQSKKNHTNTCGRWVVLRLIYYQKSYDEFVRYIHSVQIEPDLAVTMLTQNLATHDK